MPISVTMSSTAAITPRGGSMMPSSSDQPVRSATVWATRARRLGNSSPSTPPMIIDSIHAANKTIASARSGAIPE